MVLGGSGCFWAFWGFSGLVFGGSACFCVLGGSGLVLEWFSMVWVVHVVLGWFWSSSGVVLCDSVVVLVWLWVVLGVLEWS